MNIIFEKYEIINELGHGAHTKVYLARHRKLDVLRAVKYIKKSEADSDRYLQEANLIKNLKHPGIPIIYDIEEDQESIGVIEEYIDGKSMASFILENPELSVEEICRYGIQICKILEYLHSFGTKHISEKGILHLDLKPDNIMINEAHEIKIIDYDNASYESETLVKCIGSKGFAAPEQYHRLNLGKTADIYSLGILLLYMSNGGHIQSNVEIVRHENLKKIIKKCIRHNPIERYSQVDRVRLDLQKILKELSKETSKESLEINVIGMKQGIGTTHICLCLTKYLNSIGIKTVCIDATETNAMLELIENGTITPVGTYKLYGAYLLPDYNESIKVNYEEEYQIIVRDCGFIHEPVYENGITCELDSLHKNIVENKNDIDKKAIVLVGCGKYFEQKKLYKAIEILSKYANMSCILNHMSGKQVYSFIQRSYMKQKVYRMPCKYEWSTSEDALDEMFGEVIENLFPRYFERPKEKRKGIRRYVPEIFKKKKN